ncbi:MAG: 5-oxoprolinase subunit PxpA [Halioglobus sp.]|nr:5-oxoprolinase subunit PxpA [Halioglobus sp.]
MLLNCDLGESYGNWAMGDDAGVMPYIDQASIACGFHAGDPVTMQRTLALAAEHAVTIGAHPAYPDIVGFGRRSMVLSREEIIANLLYQVAALDGMARSQGLTLSYVKPHGALYHDMMSDQSVRSALLEAVARYAGRKQPLSLMLQATANAQEHRAEALALGVPLLFEVFADRCYDDTGSLLPRSQPGAVHDRERTLAQVAQLQNERAVTTQSGNSLHLEFDTLCVHGDNPEGVAAIAAIRELLNGG